VLDADVYGPSVPAMLGLSGRPESPDNKSIEPMRAFGVEAMSIGLLVDQDTPMIWRGPMATSALTQLFNDTRWGDLDYLLVDLPPGTGDIQLTLAQKIPVAGAVIVTTPQDIATLDARKALKMFEKVDVPVLGIVENMAVHVCSNCGMPSTCSARAAGSAWPRSTACRCWARCRWRSASASRAMPACRSWRRARFGAGAGLPGDIAQGHGGAVGHARPKLRSGIIVGAALTGCSSRPAGGLAGPGRGQARPLAARIAW
jgi:hypothetical protein